MQTPLEPSYREIQLTRGQVAIVDADMYDELSAWKWCALPRRSGGFYAYRGINKGMKSTLRVFMHRQIIGLEQSDPNPCRPPQSGCYPRQPPGES